MQLMNTLFPCSKDCKLFGQKIMNLIASAPSTFHKSAKNCHEEHKVLYLIIFLPLSDLKKIDMPDKSPGDEYLRIIVNHYLKCAPTQNHLSWRQLILKLST